MYIKFFIELLIYIINLKNIFLLIYYYILFIEYNKLLFEKFSSMHGNLILKEKIIIKFIEYRLISKKGEGTFSEVLKA